MSLRLIINKNKKVKCYVFISYKIIILKFWIKSVLVTKMEPRELLTNFVSFFPLGR